MLTRLWLFWLAGILALGMCIGTGLVPGWGWWYSDNRVLWRQSEALLRGSLSLGADPGDIEFDTVWAQGGVQQIWGLGVSFWRVPFEIVAKVIRQEPFPDRLAFAVALLVTIYSVLRLWVTPWKARSLAYIKHRPDVLAGCLVLVLFPPFLTMCRSWFHVYEEVEAYTYVAAIALFAVTISFVRNPTFGRFVFVAFLGGMAPLIRPTLFAYGFTSFLLACARLKRLGWGAPRWGAGIAAFCLGGALLLTTNLARFGAPFEFGHSLNLNNVPTLCYASRFAHPFRVEPLASAGKELFSILFLLPESALRLNGHEADFFPGQSPTFRWREFYFSTYDLTFLVGFSGVLLASLWTFKRRRGPIGEHQLQELRFIGAWSLLSTVPLFVFYLRFQSITSRYLLDFAPAFAVALFGCMHAAKALSPALVWKGVRMAYIQCAILVCWWCYQVFTSSHLPESRTPRTLSKVEVHWQLQREKRSWSIPVSYGVGSRQTPTGIPFNGSFWNKETGETKAAVLLFVKDPTRLELALVPASGESLPESDWAAVRAKIGLEDLKLERSIDTGEGRTLIFRPPQKLAYRSGIQILFLGLVAPNQLSEEDSKFRLLEVRWGETQARVHPATP